MVDTQILGPDGQPIARPDLSQPQTAELISLHHEWAGHPSRGLTPSRLAVIMDNAEKGDLVAQCDLFDDMEEKDAHLASEMGKRRRAIVQLDWDIVPPPSPYASEKRAAKQLCEWLTDIPDFEDMIFDITDAIGKGFVCLELEWHMVEGVWLPKTITHRPQRWFTMYSLGYREEIRLRQGGSEGEPLQTFGWITHTHRAKSGWLARAALYRVLAWPYLFKNYSVADLAEFLEIYGLPIRVGKYPPGASEREKSTLLRALMSLGHKAAGIIPQGMEIDFQDATTGKPDSYQLMIDWCEKSQSKAILGGTLTSQADGKSSTNALGNVHNEVRKDLRDSDVKQIQATLTRDLIYAIAALNGLAPAGPRRAPRFKFNVQEIADIAVYSGALPPLVGMGMKIPRKWAQERMGIPEPDADDNDLLQATKAPAMPVSNALVKDAGIAAGTAQLAGGTVTTLPPDPPARQADRTSAQVSPAMDQWIGQIKALVQQSQTLDQVRDGLMALMPNMSLDQYTAAMQQALAAAALAGRYEILREAGT